MANLKIQWIAAIIGCLSCPVVNAGITTYIYTDNQGTPLAEANDQGAITASFDYRPYGVLATGVATNGPGYTGHVNDLDVNLIYMQARYYDSALGRFLSADPKKMEYGNVLSFGKFDYANDNPLYNVDPNGKWPVPPLFQLNWFHKEVSRSFDGDVKKPVTAVYNTVDDNATITQTGKAGGGIIVAWENNVLHPSENNVSFAFGQGASYSIDIAPKNAFTVSLFGNSSTSSTSLQGSLEIGVGAHIGLDVSLDAKGNLSFKPKVGFGAGEVTSLKVAKATSLSGSLNMEVGGEEGSSEDK